MVTHYPFQLEPKARGFHVVTKEVLSHVEDLPKNGMFHLFLQHTSAGICINENYDENVLHDFGLYFERLAPENLNGIRHTEEGPDDMPAHIKSVITGTQITVPIVDGKLALGTWQGIYLCEFRNTARGRKMVATIVT